MGAAAPERTRSHAGRLVLTPHAGEMAGLTGRSKDEVQADPLGAARNILCGQNDTALGRVADLP